jgi:acyl-CoA thioesterase-1
MTDSRKMVARVLLLVGMHTCALSSLAQSSSTSTDAVVPAVGSEWVYRTRYLGSQSLGQPQKVTVTSIENGVPVFAVRFGNYEGWLYQEGEALIALAADCPSKRNPFAAVRPNVCGWGPCSIRVGETIRRDFFAITPLNGCLPEKGHVEHIGKEEVELKLIDRILAAVRAEAKLAVPGLGKTVWSSFIALGYGEVHAEAPGRQSEYIKVAVDFVPYVPASVSESVATHTREPVNASGNHTHATRRAIASPTLPRIVAIGDSLTRGLGVAAEQTYPSILQRRLRNVEIVNVGLAGDTVVDMHSRTEELRVLEADLILLSIGGNDMVRGVPRSEIEATLRTLVMRLKPLTRRLILLGLEVESENPYRGMFFDVARETGVDLIPNVLRGVHGVPEMLGADGIHPNASGYARIAENVLYGVQAILLDSYLEARSR